MDKRATLLEHDIFVLCTSYFRMNDVPTLKHIYRNEFIRLSLKVSLQEDLSLFNQC